MKRYEYVSRDEYGEFQNEILTIIRDVRKELKRCYTFVDNPVGSQEDNLVTWEEDEKFGFDLDYNLVLQSAYTTVANEIASDFFCAIEKISAQRGFSVEKKTHVIKIKKFDRKRKCELSCDFAIAIDSDVGREILTYDKHDKCYVWNQNHSYNSAKEKLKEIRNEGLSNELRDEYLKLKNSNNVDKCSYMLRIEAINNIFNNYKLSYR